MRIQKIKDWLNTKPQYKIITQDKIHAAIRIKDSQCFEYFDSVATPKGIGDIFQFNHNLITVQISMPIMPYTKELYKSMHEYNKLKFIDVEINDINRFIMKGIL